MHRCPKEKEVSLVQKDWESSVVEGVVNFDQWKDWSGIRQREAQLEQVRKVGRTMFGDRQRLHGNESALAGAEDWLERRCAA